MKLDICGEIYYERKFYYVDQESQWYKVAPGVLVPGSPVVSYKKYNDSSLYVMIEDEKLITELDSELERILHDDEKEKPYEIT